MKKLLSLFAMLGVLTSSIFAEDISAYLIGKHMDAKSARQALKGAGYEILATYDSVKDGQTIVFTNSSLKAEASKPKRAHAAVLRLFVDNQEKMISITNPVYFGRAFMQDDYNDGVFSAELQKLNGAFAGLTGSDDKVEKEDLADYRYTFMNPRYHEFIELSEGSQVDLLSKIKANSENVIFELKLNDNSTLVGYRLTLTPDSNNFVEEIGRSNASFLPYCIAVEDGKATMLHGEYYLAISYPSLSMPTFMGIKDVPGLIADDMAKPFK